VLPDYNGIELADEVAVHVSVPAWVGDVRVRRGRHAVAGDLTLVHVPGIERPHPYVDEDGQGWPDNDHRFMSFSAVVAALATATGPDILHLNDWHTAAAVGMLHDRPPTVLTIHTLGYQGWTSGGWLDRLSRSVDAFESYGGTNPLAGAIQIADRVIAVSPTYADEIRTVEGGAGLHEQLTQRGDNLIGILNGIDASVWSPGIDHAIVARFSADDLSGKDACRADFRSAAGWPDDGTLFRSLHPLSQLPIRGKSFHAGE